MDELVVEKLKCMGYKEVPKELACLLNEWKRRQDMVRPAPLSLDAIIAATFIYEAHKPRTNKSKEKPEGSNPPDGGENGVT